jgi:uncharacterized glyoxalase superfamily protein PhnB
MSAPTPARPTFIPAIVYKDRRAALKWLQDAFGFEVSGVLTDADDNIVHAEMSHADGVIMINTEWTSWTKSPASVGGGNTQRVYVQIERDIDAHCARARDAGATIVNEPADQFYGERTYLAVDFEGHYWTFSQTIKDVSVQDMEAASGFKFTSA